MKSVILRIIILILLITLIYMPNTAYATGNVISQGDGFLAAANTDLPINKTALQGTSGDIYNILFTIAVVLAIAVGMIIGIQFIMGSAAEQAKIKETLVPYVVGVFVVFAAFGIWKIAVGIGNSMENTGEQILTSQEADQNFDDVMSVSLNEIDNMTETELIDYYDKLLAAIQEQRAFAFDDETGQVINNEKLQSLNQRKLYVENKMKSLSPKYGFWNEYKGTETDEQAYTRMISTSVNSMKKSAEIQQFMLKIKNAKDYFKELGDTQKVNKLQELYERFKERYDYVRLQEMAGLEVEDTFEQSDDGEIQKNGYSLQITNTGNFQATEYNGYYKDTTTGTNLDVDIIKGTVDEYLDSIGTGSLEATIKTIKVDGIEFKCKCFTFNGFVEYYICYQIDAETLYTVELDSNETNEEALINSIRGFLTPNIQKV